MSDTICILARNRTVRAAWRKVLTTLLAPASVRIVGVAGMPELMAATADGGPVRVVFGSARDEAEQFAAWEVWSDDRQGVWVYTACPHDVPGLLGVLARGGAESGT